MRCIIALVMQCVVLYVNLICIVVPLLNSLGSWRSSKSPNVHGQTNPKKLQGRINGVMRIKTRTSWKPKRWLKMVLELWFVGYVGFKPHIPHSVVYLHISACLSHHMQWGVYNYTCIVGPLLNRLSFLDSCCLTIYHLKKLHG